MDPSLETTSNENLLHKGLDQGIVNSNTKSLLYARSSLSLISGLSAGILGLEGYYQGLSFYLFCSLVLSATFHLKILYIDKLSLDSCFQNGYLTLWTSNITGSIFSYFLFWTLGYGLVHMYA